MGRVYLAEDPALGRHVALKMLPARLINEPEQFARFHREAQILASLSHPNVATLYSLEQDQGTPFLTMELVSGETLAARLAALPAGAGLEPIEVVGLGIQMARGLQAAHERGIVHRDLKPANVARTPKGEIKILDFGLAKVMGAEAAADPDRTAAGSFPPSIGPSEYTVPGGVLGSPGYMSPEQIQGGPVGTGSDIWAFGCVLFECLAGRAAFPGGTSLSRMARTLEGEPDWTALPSNTPAGLCRLLRACLTKDPAQRISSADRLAIDLEQLVAEPGGRSESGAVSLRRAFIARAFGRHRTQRAVRLLALGTLGAAALLWSFVVRPGTRRTAPDGGDHSLHQATSTGNVLYFDLSPDDRRVAYANGVGTLVIHDLISGAYRTVHRADGLCDPHWSPDGTEVLVSIPTDPHNLVMYVVQPDSGAARAIGPENCRGMGWTPDGTAVIGTIFGPSGQVTRLLLVDRTSGDTTSLPLDADLTHFRGLLHSPADSAVVLWGRSQDGEPAAWIAAALGRPIHRILPESRPTWFQWTRDGRQLLCLTRPNEQTQMERVSIDSRSGRLTAPPERLGETTRSHQFSTFHQSEQVLYQIANSTSSMWILERGADRGWTRRRLLSGKFGLRQPRLSPDGLHVAGGQPTGEAWSVSTFSLTDGSCRSIRSNASPVTWAAWSPDGTRIAFQAGSGAQSRVCCLELASGDTRVLSSQACHGYVYWFPDDRIRYQPLAEGDRNYMLLDPETGREEPLLRGPSRGTIFQTAVSPDGAWLAAAGNRNDVLGVALWLIDLTDQSERLLLEQPAVPVGWSRDGAFVYIVQPIGEMLSQDVEQNRISRLRIQDRTLEPLTALPEGDLVFWSDADISLDEDRIAVTVNHTENDLWVAPGPVPVR